MEINYSHLESKFTPSFEGSIAYQGLEYVTLEGYFEMISNNWLTGLIIL